MQNTEFCSQNTRSFFMGCTGLYVICRRSACNLLIVKCRVDQAKESWEMDEDEKLEQAEIMKGNGTKFFKVSHMVSSIFHWPVIANGHSLSRCSLASRGQ